MLLVCSQTCPTDWSALIVTVDARRVNPPTDSGMAEQWERATNEPYMVGVEAWLPKDEAWRIVVAPAEFVHWDPFETEMATGIESAIAGVAGVTSVWREDREQWVAGWEPVRARVGRVGRSLPGSVQSDSAAGAP